jgi:ArsR family transcriptional regulator
MSLGPAADRRRTGRAATLAALLSGAYIPAPGERVGVVISGGNTPFRSARRRRGDRVDDVIDASIVKALANDRRLEIMNWLKDPTAHFRPQVDGDLVKDGVCGLFIAKKLGVSQPTASEHLRILTAAGLIRGKRIKQWTFYKRDEKRIAEVKREFRKAW